MFFEEDIERLKARLADDLPGEAAQSILAPQHRKTSSGFLPPGDDYRLAAVTILLTASQKDQSLSVLLIERSDYDGVHSGQIALPGGKPEPGEDLLQTAMRELEEETGIPVSSPKFIGKLTPLYIPPSRFLVHPFVVALEHLPEIHPQEREVKRVFSIPVSDLNPSNCMQGEFKSSGGLVVNAPYYLIDQDKRMWGATAMILSELYTIYAE